jgi:hypothetical protein
MVDRSNYFVYFLGGGCGNFIACLCLHTLSQGHIIPQFSPQGHSHMAYIWYLQSLVPEWPSDSNQLPLTVDQCAEPWLVMCPPLDLKTQFDQLRGTTRNLIISIDDSDQLELLFNHYYKNLREGPMEYSTDTLNLYQQLQNQGLLPPINNWYQLSVEQSWLLLTEQLKSTCFPRPQANPDDLVLAYRDIMDQPAQTLNLLKEYLGQDLHPDAERYYDRYLELNRQLKRDHWLGR